MAELVVIPISFFEVTIDYAKPLIRLLGDRVPLVEAIFEALSPHHPALDDLEVLTAGKNSEQGLIFKLPQKQISFFVGATMCRFSRNAVNWSLAEETLSILDAVVSTVASVTGADMGRRLTSMGMHLQPKSLSFKDILRPFVPQQFAALESTQFLTMANITRWGDRAITIDGSGSLANGLFLKLEREFQATTSYEEMAGQLRNDEEKLFSILGIEEDRQ